MEVMLAAHEEIERLERLIVTSLSELNQSTTRSDRLKRSHRIRKLIDRTIHISRDLARRYENNEILEHEFLNVSSGCDHNVFGLFYDALKDIRAHKVDVGDYDIMAELELEESLNPIQFSGEEGLGCYLDLHEFHQRYINSDFGQPIDYLDYLDRFSTITSSKVSRSYKDYVGDLLEYLVSFVERSEPLRDIDRVLTKASAEFEEQWKSNNHQRKRKRDIAPKTSMKKKVLMADYKVKKLCEVLKETIDRTKEHVKNRMLMSYKELVRDREDLMNGDEEEASEDEGRESCASNPLKLPMGSDGKPIPYWLYKLHGLDKEFKCEICGNCSYRGRREFEKHFKEARHQHGMRCLGIPNTKCFNEVTEIMEAKKLWEQIQQREKLVKWQPEIDEECEDDEGNVYDKKTYLDLARQGLI